MRLGFAARAEETSSAEQARWISFFIKGIEMRDQG
jgi:hypothetical protein